MSLILAAALAGTLCIEGDCRPLERMPSRVAPAEAPRAFVWLEPGRVVTGTIAADAHEWPAGEWHRIELRLSDARAVPVTLELIASERTWTWSMPAAGAFTLEHPRGVCTLRATAEGYRGATAPLADVTAPLGSVTTLLLRRLPVLRGVVVDADGATPLAGAVVSVPGTSSRAVTGENGAFQLAVEGDWPRVLEVEHPARAAKLVSVPKTVADAELPAIRMSAGGTLRLHVAPPVGGREALSWDVRDGAQVARAGAFEPGSATAEIEALAPGDYRVLIRGAGPLQRFVTNVRVADAQVTDAFAEIRPLLVEGAVTFGEAPLHAAGVEVRAPGGGWIETLKTDDNGRFAEELWQQGEYAIGVFRAPLVAGWVTRRELTGVGRIRLELDIPNRIVRGRVVDAQSGAPVAGALVSLTARAGSDALRLRVRTAADGGYEFTAVEPGPARLEVFKAGYRFARSIPFTVGEDEPLHEEVLVVEALPLARTVVVTDLRGAPLPGAAVFVPNRRWDDLLFAAQTDAQGRATIHLRSSRERGTLFVVPRSGSLGFATVAGEGELPVRIDDRASVVFAVESTSGEPLPRVMVMLSINGVPVPPRVLAEMARIQGVPLSTDASGRLVQPRLPAGHYDCEPVAGRGKVGAAVNVAVLPGEQTVKIRLSTDGAVEERRPYFR